MSKKNKSFEVILKKVFISLFFLLLCVFVCLYLGDYFSKPGTYQSLNNTIDAKAGIMLKLTGASTVISTAITVIPDDIATPIATEFAKLTEAYAAILIILFAEKYLMPILGFVAFRIIIPISFGMLVINQWSDTDAWKNRSLQLIKLALIIFAVIPVGIKCSDMIDDTYKQSIEATVTSATIIADDAMNLSEESSSGKGTFGIKEKVNSIRERALNSVHNFIESLAVMVVTTMVIPIVVVIVFFLIVKKLTGLDVNSEASNIIRFKHQIDSMKRETIGEKLANLDEDSSD